jgi:hypothetical protein
VSFEALRDTTLGTGQTIGRYFSVVSVVPSVLLALWVFFLVATGALSTAPSVDRALGQVRDLGAGGALLLLAGALLLALALHPLQFALVQFFEGYWGGSRIAREVRVRRTLAHLHRLQTAVRAASKPGSASRSDVPAAEVLMRGEEKSLTKALIRELVDREVAAAVRLRYPQRPEHLMATRLGNVLRRHEMRAGAPYGLQILRTATMLGLVADQGHVNYLNDRRSELDLAVRMCAVALVAAVVTFLLMWPHGFWLLLTLVPYTIAWLSYRGAVVSAGHYGQALEALVHLNRFALYRALQLKRPSNPVQESEQNEDLDTLLEGHDPGTLVYRAEEPT